MILWHISQNRYTWMAESILACHPHIETHLYTLPPPRPRLLHSAFAPVLDVSHDCRRPGAASLTIKIVWPNAMRFFFLRGCAGLCISAACTAGCACAGKRIIAAISEIDRDMLQRVWVKMDYRFDVCRVTKGGHVEHLWGVQKKKKELGVFLFPSVGRVLTVLSANQVYWCYEMRQGIINP